MADILTSDEYNAVRYRLGADVPDFVNAAISSIAFQTDAEQEIRARFAANLSPTLASVDDIITADGDDLENLKIAVINYIGAMWYDSATNAVNTAITQSKITIDRGGIGAQWQTAKEESLKSCDRALRRITGWQVYRLISA